MEIAQEQQAKHRITLVSVAAALLLTSLKLAVGLLTGSLGILSEALHSGLDLVASVLTLFSVRIADRPPDEDHPYGHGRFENLSATVQGLLLLATSGFIIFESIRRLFFVSVEVEASIWTFLVMIGSIVLDLWRSRMLSRAARQYHSKAMEADALNFRADMFSSAVVILGLALVAIGDATGRAATLEKADSIAAMIVALAILYMAGKLAVQGAGVLTDRIQTELRDEMTRAVAAVPGVVQSGAVRLRESGNRLFADIVVSVPRTASLAEAHSITERVEESIRQVEPRTETVVHVEPVESDTETAAERLRAVALSVGAPTHHEVVHAVDDHLEASLHLEVDPSLSLQEAHALSERLGTALEQDNPRLRRVDIHIEVIQPHAERQEELTSGTDPLSAEIKRLISEAGMEARCHEVRLYASDTGHSVVLHVDFPGGTSMGEIHRRTEILELLLRGRLLDLEMVVIHAEPSEDSL